MNQTATEIADEIVPSNARRGPGGEERETAAVAVIEDLEGVVSRLTGERSEPPVVEDEEPCSRGGG